MTIREALLTALEEQQQLLQQGYTLQQDSVLRAAASKLGRCDEEALLTQWSELFRTGLLAWGLNLSNPGPPFFHLTEQGRRALANASRDPSNPMGYLRHLQSLATPSPIAMSYIAEGLDCYVGGQFKASAVMVGCASERMLLDLRDAMVTRLTTLQQALPQGINDWKIKTVTDTLHRFFEARKGSFDRSLREAFDSFWAAFVGQLRTTRNDAGHPASLDPVTPETAHACLLVFPEVARITTRLTQWVSNDLV